VKRTEFAGHSSFTVQFNRFSGPGTLWRVDTAQKGNGNCTWNPLSVRARVREGARANTAQKGMGIVPAVFMT
jgi:hypothetical protein